jgi:nucleotide-binding universal stress UspA family protein
LVSTADTEAWVACSSDGSRGAELALSEGIAVVKATGATLHLLHVVEAGSLGPDARSVLKEGKLTERVNEIVSTAIETAEAASLDAIESETESGVPSKEIRNYMKRTRLTSLSSGRTGRPISAGI